MLKCGVLDRLIEDAIEQLVLRVVATAEGAVVIDGSFFSPSTRALPCAEIVWDRGTAADWEAFEEALERVCDAGDLYWSDGMLWKGELSEEYGIKWESNGQKHDGGLAVFSTREDRDEAIAWLSFLGYQYLTEYRDTQGYGLSWAWRTGPLRIKKTPIQKAPSIRLGYWSDCA